MLAKHILRDIMDRKGIGITKMAKICGFKYPQTVSDRLGTGKSANMSTDTLDQMVRALGYKVLVVPEDVKMRDGWYEIDDSKNTLIPKRIAEYVKLADREKAAEGDADGE